MTEGLTADLLGARVITTMFVNDQPQTAIELLHGVNKYRWGLLGGREVGATGWQGGVGYWVAGRWGLLGGREVDRKAHV